MSDVALETIELVVDSSDPGDDTGRRYRYQWTYAAILCCRLLDHTHDVVEIFCEHFEDILLKHQSGKLSGYQVKTRASNQPVWKANDPQLFSALKRFVLIDHHHADCFRSFHFLTNHPFHNAKNGKSIPHIIRTIKRSNSLSEVKSPINTYINKIASETKCSIEQVYLTLKKTYIKDSLPKLTDATMRLIVTLTDNWEQANNCSLSDIKRVAETLIEECERASTLSHYDVLPAYIDSLEEAEDIELKARIAGKTICLDYLLDLLKKGLDGEVTLHNNPDLLVEPGEGQIELLEKKLDAGGFSIVSINLAKDLRDRADYYGTQLIHKNGREKGLQKYNELRSFVLSDAARAFETTKREDPFGLDMLAELRKNLSVLHKENTKLYGSRIEHLEGLAYSLTSQCKIQWSVNRPWEDE